MNTQTITNLPSRFIQDCLECGCDIGDAEFDQNGRITLTATPEQLWELRSRAGYYADPYGPDGDGLIGIKSSARAILKRLENH